MPPASRGASGRGLGLLAPVPVPVGVLVWALGVLNAFLGDPSRIRPQILGALREANLYCGASGFFDVLSGAHANIVTHDQESVFKSPQYFCNNTAGPFRGRQCGWWVGGGLTSRPIPRWLASRCPRPSRLRSCWRKHQ